MADENMRVIEYVGSTPFITALPLPMDPMEREQSSVNTF